MNRSQLEFSDVPPQHFPIFSDLAPHVVEKFLQFHKENPHVFELFKKFAHQAKAKWNHFGAGAIFERLRWEFSFETNDEFKLNNNYRSCYTRLLVLEDPSFKNFFQFRHTPGTIPGVQ